MRIATILFLALALASAFGCAGSRDTPAQRAELIAAMEADAGALYTFLEENGVQLRERGLLALTSPRRQVSNAQRVLFADVLNQPDAVYVYDYEDSEQARTDARRLNFGGTVRTAAERRSSLGVLVPPTTVFPVFQSGRFLVVHAGPDQTLTELLTRMFGRPVRS